MKRYVTVIWESDGKLGSEQLELDGRGPLRKGTINEINVRFNAQNKRVVAIMSGRTEILHGEIA